MFTHIFGVGWKECKKCSQIFVRLAIPRDGNNKWHCKSWTIITIQHSVLHNWFLFICCRRFPAYRHICLVGEVSKIYLFHAWLQIFHSKLTDCARDLGELHPVYYLYVSRSIHLRSCSTVRSCFLGRYRTTDWNVISFRSGMYNISPV